MPDDAKGRIGRQRCRAENVEATVGVVNPIVPPGPGARRSPCSPPRRAPAPVPPSALSAPPPVRALLALLAHARSAARVVRQAHRVAARGGAQAAGPGSGPGSRGTPVALRLARSSSFTPPEKASCSSLEAAAEAAPSAPSAAVAAAAASAGESPCWACCWTSSASRAREVMSMRRVGVVVVRCSSACTAFFK